MILNEETKINKLKEPELVRARPVLLSVLCLIFFVYFTVLSLLCLAGLFYSGWITRVTIQYLPTGAFTKVQTFLFFGAGFLLHGLAFTGILLIWKLRKTGYYMLGVSCLIIASCQLLIPFTAITSTAIYVILLLLFGVFFRRMH